MPLPAPALPPAACRETAASEARLDAVFAALADPTRRRILAMLLEDDMAVSDVAEPFAMSLAAISKHLATLAAAGLIRQERRGRITWCQIDPEGMRGASVWMRAFGSRWREICRTVGLQRASAHHHWIYGICRISHHLNQQRLNPRLSMQQVIDLARADDPAF